MHCVSVTRGLLLTRVSPPGTSAFRQAIRSIVGQHGLLSSVLPGPQKCCSLHSSAAVTTVEERSCVR